MLERLLRRYVVIVVQNPRHPEVRPRTRVRRLLQPPRPVGNARVIRLRVQLEIERKLPRVLGRYLLPAQPRRVQQVIVLANHAMVQNHPAGRELAPQRLKAHKLLIRRQHRRPQRPVPPVRHQIRKQPRRENAFDRRPPLRRHCEIARPRLPRLQSQPLRAPPRRHPLPEVRRRHKLLPVETLPRRPLLGILRRRMRKYRQRIRQVHLLPLQQPAPLLHPRRVQPRRQPRRLRRVLLLGQRRRQLRAQLRRRAQPGRRQLLPDGPLQLRHPRRRRRAHFERPRHLPRAVQNPVERVVVLGRNRVNLVVVAPGAGNRRPLKRLRQRVNLVVHHVRPQLPKLVAVVVAHLPQPVERRRQHRLVPPVHHPRLRQQIPRHVFPHELVVGNVPVEGPDQVIAIVPRALNLVVPLVAVRLGVAHHVHPVPRPPFAVARRSQQRVHVALVSPRAPVVQKPFQQPGLRRQSRHHISRPPRQYPPVRLRRQAQPRRRPLRIEKPVHRMRRLPRRRRHAPHRLIGPVLPPQLFIKRLRR